MRTSVFCNNASDQIAMLRPGSVSDLYARIDYPSSMGYLYLT